MQIHRLVLFVVVFGASGFCVGCKPSEENATAALADQASTDDGASGPNAAAASEAEGAGGNEVALADQTADAENADAPANERVPVAAKNRIKLPDSSLTAGIPGSGPLTVQQIASWLDNPENHEPLTVELPVGLDVGAKSMTGLESNPLTRAKIELGRQLYFDQRLSADDTVSCASCHHPDEGFSRHTQFGVGIRGQEGGRNSPVSYNRILSGPQFWDGRAASLEAQAVGPIANPIEMGNTHEACVERVWSIPGYKMQFDKIFGERSIEAIGKAIASFERVLVTGPSPYDYQNQVNIFKDVDLEDLQDSDPEAYGVYQEYKALAESHPMSDSAKRGMGMFFTEKANCSACHVGANLTDELYHNLGVGMAAEKPDQGRAAISGDEKDTGAFKTPTIRNVAQSAPYMHDGSQKTLAEVVEWYAKGGHPNAHLSQRVKKLDLTEQDKADLVAFMEACTGDFPIVARERLPQ